MADGHTHTKVTIFHGTYFSIVLHLCGFHSIPAFAAGFFYQIFSSPDLDVDGGNIGLYYLRKYTGFLHVYWRILWYPYAVCMKHRGKSHAIYGTIVRFMYLISPFIMFMPLRDGNQPRFLRCAVSQLMCVPIQIFIGFAIAKWGIGACCLFVTGVFLGDLIHLAFDGYWYKHI